MYEERASNKRVVLTTLGFLGSIVVVLVVGGALIGSLLSAPAIAPVSTSDASPPAPQAPVTETVEPSQPETFAVSEPEPVAPPVAPTPAVTGVVCIDPGHQGRGDSNLEPIGPGAAEKKPRVTGGTRGVATGRPESEVVLEISLKLRDELVRRGVEVVMVRETQDINISNSERAAIANNANADLFIRVHCDGSGDSSRQGFFTLVPQSNQWTAPIVSESRRAGELVQAAAIAESGARDLGIVERGNLSGFNWATVPSILVEMGYMTNPEEDRRLSDPSYQQKLVVGMSNGIVEYLNTK